MFGVEALVRWQHPVQGAMSPSIFVAVAEEGGLIEVLGLFTLRQAFGDGLRWPGLIVSVNVSAIQLRSSCFVAQISTRSWPKPGPIRAGSNWRSPKACC